MPTRRELRIPLTPDGSIDYQVLQREGEVEKFNSDSQYTRDEPDERRDQFQNIIDESARRRAVINEGSITRQVSPTPSVQEQIPTGLWNPEESADMDRRVEKAKSRPREYHATNIPETKQKWEKEGKKVNYIPPEEVPKKPGDDDILSAEMTGGLWKLRMQSNNWEEDPRKINPIDYATKKRDEWEREHPAPSKTDLRGDPNPDYTEWRKDREAYFKEYLQESRADRAQAIGEFRDIVNFSQDKKNIEEAKMVREENRAIKEEEAAAVKRPTEFQMYESSKKTLSDPSNRVLPKGTDPSTIKDLSTYPMNPRVLEDMNHMLKEARLPPVEEKKDPGSRRYKYLLFGKWEIGDWRQETPPSYTYPSAKVAKPAPVSTPTPAKSAPTGMTETSARKALADKGITGADQDSYIQKYKQAGKVK